LAGGVEVFTGAIHSRHEPKQGNFQAQPKRKRGSRRHPSKSCRKRRSRRHISHGANVVPAGRHITILFKWELGFSGVPNWQSTLRCKGPPYREWSIASCLITTIEPLPKPMPRYRLSPSHRIPAIPYGIGKAMPCWKPSRSIVRISVHFFVPIPPVAICDAGRRETPGAFDLCVTAALRDDASERRSRLGRMAPR